MKRRLDRRVRTGASTSDASWEVYLAQKQWQQPIVEVPRFRHIVADTTVSTQVAVETVETQLKEALG